MFKLNGEHGEVVTLLGIAYELVHGIGHSLNQLLWRAIEICDDVGDALHAEKFVGSILGLRQSVSIEEEGRVGCYHGFLFGECHVGHRTNRKIRIAGQQGSIDVRSVVTGVTVAQVTCGQIEHANKQCDEHIIVVALADVHIHGLHDMTRLCGVG